MTKYKILISTDMEGLSGVSRWSQVTPTSPDYAEGKLALKRDLSTVINQLNASAKEKGHTLAIEVVDGHWTGTNLDPADWPGIGIRNGTRMDWGMVDGVHNADGLILLGYHGCAGSGGAMSHTWDTTFTKVELELNDDTVLTIGEVTLATLLAQMHLVPLIGISGDDHAIEETRLCYPRWVPSAQVKRSLSNESVLHDSPERVEGSLSEMARQAINKLGSIGETAVLPVKDLTLTATFATATGRDKARLVPGTRISPAHPLSLTYKGDIKMVFDALRTWAMLA